MQQQQKKKTLILKFSMPSSSIGNPVDVITDCGVITHSAAPARNGNILQAIKCNTNVEKPREDKARLLYIQEALESYTDLCNMFMYDVILCVHYQEVKRKVGER